MQVNAGHVLYRQSEPGDAIYIVLNGRLRSITEEKEEEEVPSTTSTFSFTSSKPHLHPTKEDTHAPQKGGRFHVIAEHGQGDSVGEKEVLMQTYRPVTTHAIRDTELTRFPHTLFNVLALRHPEITLTMAKLIASRSHFLPTHSHSRLVEPSLGMINLSKNNVNLKTVALLPVAFADMTPMVTFAEKLHQAFQLIGVHALVLNQASVLSILGKYAFSKMGKLKLMNWLNEQEDVYGMVVYLADGGVHSPWTQRCIRQADCILLVAVANHDPGIGEYERYVLGVKTTARKERLM
ncbi:phosphatidylcholine and lysophosphatidylcholine phospholipase [Coelomomyces lativittatus]|nr:phosphatidylcholine and lysophosphatidylcholine phospholipase [Coelomomyces lativittatus]